MRDSRPARAWHEQRGDRAHARRYKVTVTAHVSKMWQKLVLCDRIHAVVIAYKHGILSRN